MIKSAGPKIIIILLFILYLFQFSHYDFSDWRYVHVRVLIDNEYTNSNKNWPTDVPSIIKKTSVFFEERFKIKLIITSWGTLITMNRSPNFNEVALSDKNDGNDVLIGFSGRDIPFNQAEHMYSMILINGANQTQENQIESLKHEVAHLFLARHNPATSDITDKDFDGFNKFVIRFNKYQNFQIGKILYGIYLAYLKSSSMKILI